MTAVGDTTGAVSHWMTARRHPSAYREGGQSGRGIPRSARALARLERHAGKLARAVLRGLGGSNPARLPGGCRVTGIPTAIYRHQDAEKAELPPFPWSHIPCSGMIRTVRDLDNHQRRGGEAVTFDDVLEQAMEMLRRRGRVPIAPSRSNFSSTTTCWPSSGMKSWRCTNSPGTKRARCWSGPATPRRVLRAYHAPPDQAPAPLAYTPPYLAEKILTSRSALEGERKQVTVLFADLKGSMELLADRDPEEARPLLDPVLERMMEAVHRYEGTVNQVMGDGIMALFGAPLAHEDHAVRACYATLHMQEAMAGMPRSLRRQQGLDVQIRVGLNSGEVVVRAIGNDLHMDYSAVGQTTHLAARMEQLATPGTVLLTADTLRLVEGYVAGHAVGTGAGEGADRSPSRSSSWTGRSACGAVTGGGRTGPDALCGARHRAGVSAPGPGTGWRGAGAGGGAGRGGRAWASPACSTSSPSRTTPRAGCCWRATRCPTARPPPTCRSWTCSRSTSKSDDRRCLPTSGRRSRAKS